MKILVISGANLNKLGQREKIYGDFTLSELQSELVAYAGEAELEFFTSNHEGEIIEAVQNCNADALIINAGGYSHTSVAIADALSMLTVPKIEVHLTNIHSREEYRRFTVTGSKCDGVITGLGIDGYKAAIDIIKRRLSKVSIQTQSESAPKMKENDIMRNIAFIGMMGTGKTVTAKVVAQKLGKNYLDIDDCIVAKMGMPISVAFLQLGEKTFRDYEYDIMCSIVWQENFIISCGGGVPLFKRNMDLIQDFIKVRLTASPEVIYERTKDDFARPLLKDNSPKKIAQIIDEREEAYSAAADITVSTDGKTVEQVADEVIKKLQEKNLI